MDNYPSAAEMAEILEILARFMEMNTVAESSDMNPLALMGRVIGLPTTVVKDAKRIQELAKRYKEGDG